MDEPITEATARMLIAYMRGYWPPLDDDPEVVHAWQTALKGIQAREAITAIDWIGMNTQREFAPTPGIVRARVLNARGPAPAELPDDVMDNELPSTVPRNLRERREQMERVRQFPEYIEARAALARAKLNQPRVPGLRSIGQSLDDVLP